MSLKDGGMKLYLKIMNFTVVSYLYLKKVVILACITTCIKDETWYVQEGEFLYRWIDTETGTEIHTNKV